jgi:hypothetical protein
MPLCKERRSWLRCKLNLQVTTQNVKEEGEYK